MSRRESAQPVSQSSNPLLALLGSSASKRVRWAISSYFVAETAFEVGKKVRNHARSQFVYTVAVPSGDELYTELHERILELIPHTRRRSTIVRAMRGNRVQSRHEDMPIASADSDSTPKLRPGVFYDSSREQNDELAGHVSARARLPRVHRRRVRLSVGARVRDADHLRCIARDAHVP